MGSSSFNEQFGLHSAWRRTFAQQLRKLSEWMSANELMGAAIEERLHRLEAQMRSDKVMVAFVAEFSRGKSELINAIFFADYGQRIMPASAGRTTMCPTELGYEGDIAPCLRLLPIETRLEPQGLAEWRLRPERWEQVPLDVDNPQQIAQALEKVSQVRYVSQDQARALGFWHDDAPDENPVPNAEGLVEVPLWRHALINMPHPLLKQGLVILDTPGLNAVGAEPELTVSLIPQAHAVLFILGADTGVTRSDLSIWREHLTVSGSVNDMHWVVLNKIDTLWDALSTPEQVQSQLDRQCATVAEILQVPLERVLPISAQKGLVAKIAGDAQALQTSRLPQLEVALAEGILSRRQDILRAAVTSGIVGLRTEVARIINVRLRDFDEQMLELRSLRGKNTSVIEAMRGRIELEQSEFEASATQIHAVRSVHLKLLGELFHQLGARALKAELSDLTQALQQRGLKLGVRKVYAETFERLRTILAQASASATDIHTLLSNSFRELNTEFGFSLHVPPIPELQGFVQDVTRVEQSHVQYLSVSNALKLVQPEFTQRLVRALGMRMRTVFESMANDLELWSKSATAQLDVQLRERKRSFVRRIEAVDRIQHAASGLDERIGEIEASEQHLQSLQRRLTDLTDALMALPIGSNSNLSGPPPSPDSSLYATSAPHQIAA